MRVAVIGVGKVGLPLACHLADNGHEVIVYDKSKELMRMIREGENPFPWESGIITANLHTAPSLTAAIKTVEAVFIVTPTPEIGNYLSSNSVTEVLGTIEEVAEHDLVISVVSTLDPRDASRVCSKRPRMEIVYNPPLIRLGQVKKDYEEANILFLGYDGKDLTPVERIASFYIHPKQVFNRVIGNVLSIACAKLAINATLSMRAAWANDIASKASAMGANIETIFRALSHEKRIGGTTYMLPGPPPGGPCLPRDMETWSAIGHQSHLVNSIKTTHDEIQRSAVIAVMNVIASSQTRDYQPQKILLIGLGYKVNGPDITRSIALDIAMNISAKYRDKIEIYGYDPVAGSMFQKIFPNIKLVNSIGEISGSDILTVICHNYPNFVISGKCIDISFSGDKFK